jgi:azurin
LERIGKGESKIMVNQSRRSFLRTLALSGGMLASGAVVAACGGGAAPAAPAERTAVTLELGSKGDELAWDKNELVAPANSSITIKFKNNSSAGGNKHNVVICRPADADGVAADGIAAGEANSYEKPGDTRILAATKLIDAGASAELKFDPPASGSYTYICTFPGHNVGMKGTLKVG